MAKKIKYKKEITELFEKLVEGINIPDTPKDKLVYQLVLLAGGYEKLDSALEEGITNGYTLEQQLIIVETTLKAIMHGDRSNLANTPQLG